MPAVSARYDPDMIVDVHAHCIPIEFREWLIQKGTSVGVEVVELDSGAVVRFPNGIETGSQFGWPSLSDTDSRIAAMDTMGVDVQILAGWIDLVGYEIDSQNAIEYANAHNHALVEEQARRPERFRSLATVPLQEPALAAEALAYAMTELGMAGAQVATTVRGRYLDEVEGLDAFWEVAEELGAFVLLHPLRPLGQIDLDRYFLKNSVGRPAETSIALAGLIMSGVLERFPNLILCAVHGGGFIPFQIGRLDKAFHQVPGLAQQRMTKPPSNSLRNLYVDSIVHDPEALAFLVKRMGTDRVLLGTDYPFPMGDQDPVGLIRSTPGLTDRAVDSMLGENALRLIG
jgi:aminocarboxymuconate-semialdehyde decarboxylase